MIVCKGGMLWFLSLCILIISNVYSSNPYTMYELDGYSCEYINTKYYERPGLNLCDKSKLIFDCSNQVVSVNSYARCEMQKINATECTDELFKEKMDKNALESVGTVKLTPYLHCEKFAYTSFNMTCSKPQWKHLRLRYLEEGQNIGKNCREITLSGDVDITSTISYDCLFDAYMEGKNYRFQYVVTTKEGNEHMASYLFTVPSTDNLKGDTTNSRSKFRIFMMIDESDYTLKIQVPPKIFNVSNTTITLYYKENKYDSAEKLKTEFIDLTDKEEKEFINLFETLDSIFLHSGFYYYNATFYSSYCGDSCQPSLTPDIHIKGWGELSRVLAAVFLISLMALCLAIYLTWKSKYREVAQGPEKPQNVLLIYESIFPSHIEDIYKFKEYLEENCFVRVKLDLIDIPMTESKDPWEWYVKAFESADNVLVFASPAGDVEKGLHQDNVYHNLHVYAYKLLVFYLLHRNKCSKVAGIRLPGSSWDTLPPEAKIISRDSRFALPYQLNELFKFLKIAPLMDGASKLSGFLMSPRKPPTLVISKPITSLRYPDIDEEDNEIRNQLPSLDGLLFNCEGTASSASGECGDDDDDDENGFILEGFKA